MLIFTIRNSAFPAKTAFTWVVAAVCALSLAFSTARATEVADRSHANGAYLDQPEPGLDAELFLPEMLSQSGRGACIGFLKRGTVFVFKLLSPGLDWKFEPLYFSELRDGTWSSPAVVPFSDLYPYNFTVAPDDTSLYFSSLRSKEDHDVILGQADVWKVEYSDGGWTNPERFDPPVNSDRYFENYPSVSADGTLHFMSRREDGFGKDDIYRLSLVDGQYGKPENMGKPVNSEFPEVDPFAGADGSYLIFCSDPPGGHGRYDLYISFRQEDGAWTQPANMGESVNSPGAELRPIVTPDGKYLFFTSDRSGSGETYWVDAEIIESIKRQVIFPAGD